MCVQELQEALKSFLDLACHCDIYDLFDDALFDTIALDPSGWLEEFVNDKDVKIIIISSIGELSIGTVYLLLAGYKNNFWSILIVSNIYDLTVYRNFEFAIL